MTFTQHPLGTRDHPSCMHCLLCGFSRDDSYFGGQEAEAQRLRVSDHPVNWSRDLHELRLPVWKQQAYLWPSPLCQSVLRGGVTTSTAPIHLTTPVSHSGQDQVGPIAGLAQNLQLIGSRTCVCESLYRLCMCCAWMLCVFSLGHILCILCIYYVCFVYIVFQGREAGT